MSDARGGEEDDTGQGGSDAPAGIPAPVQTPLFHALEASRYQRQSQIRDIEALTGRRLIAYVAGPYTSISGIDIPPFVDLLHDVKAGESLDLMLHTPGGEVDQAERIIMLCRKRVKDTGEFRVIVPDAAKSAGTLIALASDEIVMGEPSELGPIDPQVQIVTASGEPMARPAQSFLDGLDRIVSESEDEVSPAYFPLLDKLDPALIDFCEKAVKQSEEFAQRYLKKYMLSHDHETADFVAADLVNVEKYLSHAAVIDSDHAEGLGLNVRFLPHDDLLWQAYWRLYIAMRLTWDTPGRRLFEGRKASLLV